MTKNKDQKRLIRARMEKTGESYTAARAVLLAKQAPPIPTPKRDWAKVAGMSDAAVKAKTGRSWAGWVDALDDAGSYDKSHRDIAKHIGATYPDVSGWWAQTITVGYERIRGLRDVGQQRSGAYEANKSRTFPVGVSTLYRICSNPRLRTKWLAEGIAGPAKTTKETSIRWPWQDGQRVQLYFTPKGDNKTSLAIQHTRLASREDVERAKLFWSERLDALGGVLADAAPRSKTDREGERRDAIHPGVAAYFDAAKPEHRAALQQIRQTVQRVAPDSNECISYQLPAFEIGGKRLVAYGAATKHCALYPMSPKVIEALAGDLTPYSTSKGSIRFTPDKPMPAALIRKIVKARLSELR